MTSESNAWPDAPSSIFEGLLADLSRTLVEGGPERSPGRLEAAVGRTAAAFALDCAWVAHRALDGGPVDLVARWTRPGCFPLPPFDPGARLPWISARLDAGLRTCLASLDELPREGALDRRFLEQLGIRSLVSLPFGAGGTPVGWLAVGASRAHRAWPPHVIEPLGHVATIVGSALAHERAEDALRRANAFDRVIAQVAASLIHVPLDAIDSQIVGALGALGELLGADRASIIQDFPDEQLVRRTHRWVRAGTSGPPASDPRDAFPWLIARVFGDRDVVALTHLDDLPAEASRDREALERSGVVSGAVAPMVVEGRVVGVLVLATTKKRQQWSPELVTRLRLVGEILASALARRETERSLRSDLADNERLRAGLEAENVHLKVELGLPRDFGEIVGRSAALRGTLAKVSQVADTDAPVLLLGETGTGKELLARAVHSHSRRRYQAFIAVNCAALPATLIEDELFGHEKGAFTGASHAKPGRFELADRGTLLLDEIGDLDPALQTKLLRVLEDGELQRLGATVTKKVDVRIVAATNRDLRHDMQEGRFRPDLFYRLGVFPIQVPPLRDRREDIPLLVWHFIQSRNRSFNRSVSKIPQAAMAALQAYDWPGNVRELQNVIERALILSPGAILRIDDAFGPGVEPANEVVARRSRADSLEDVERAHIVQVLERCGWRIEGRGHAAERLGLNASTLRNRMRKLGITRPRS
jgi:transcriptional regulator with GAF, ATPase, and Fis domain